ncbi:alpha/beta fold hydrolase [Streptomyces sp. NPDC018019]|uniref:alpha/beta fold hydrolase n=1 Tax=Streptomyces sp. NPDC018019 TaxID=3365030 RepID=UPI0037BD7A7A
MPLRPEWHLLEGGAARVTTHPTVIAAAHGLQASWRTWGPLARHLPSGTRLYALDLPWRAGNDYGWRHTADASQHLARALQAVPERPDVLVAHSFGANAALGYLTQPPPWASRPRAAALAAPFFRTEDCPADRAVFERHREKVRALMAEAVRSRLGHRSEELGEAVRTAMERTAIARLPPQTHQALFDSYRATGVLDLSAVHIPVLVAVGEKDPGVDACQGRALTGRLPTATLRVYRGVGHFLTHQAPKSFAADITALSPAYRTDTDSPSSMPLP